MDHPFIVGSSYANNLGEYTVLKVEPENIVVRYADGREDILGIALQTRVVARLQAEAEPLSEEPSGPSTARRGAKHRSDVASSRFQGLLETDFKNNVTGTTWRSRDGLGGLVARKLTSQTGRDYASWAMYREPMFLVYAPHLPMKNKAEGVKAPKFNVRLDSERLSFGLYLEKPDAAMDEGWCWPRFLRLLGNARWQRDLQRAMTDRQLRWRVDLEAQQSATGEDSQPEQLVVSSFGPDAPFATFAAFVEHLEGLSPERRCNLYLEATLDKRESLGRGARVAEQISDTFHTLAPLYQELVGRPDNASA